MRAVDRLVDVGDASVKPPSDAVAKQPGASGPGCADRPLGDDAALLGAASKIGAISITKRSAQSRSREATTSDGPEGRGKRIGKAERWFEAARGES